MNTPAITETGGRLERPGLQLIWGAGTYVGKVRSVNEDGYIATPGIWAVADGMGGHAAGRVASEIVVDACITSVDEAPMSLETIPVLLEDANRRVRERARTDGHEMMGTTVCGIALVDNGGDDGLLVFNVGDSRCYQLPAGQDLVQLTTDHSYVQELVDLGEITSEEARHHPNRNVVSRAIGIDETVTPDFLLLPEEPKSRLLLCSDGVSGEIEDDDLATILRDARTPTDAATRLLDEVAVGPARDNATVIVLDITWGREETDPGGDTGSDPTTIPRAPVRSLEESGETGNGGASHAIIDRIPDFTPAEPAKRTTGSLVDGIPGKPLPSGDAAT